MRCDYGAKIVGGGRCGRPGRLTETAKGIDPRHIDATLAVHAAAWVLAEFLRLYHSGEKVVAEATASLMRGHVPFVETFGDENVVTRKVFGVGLAAPKAAGDSAQKRQRATRHLVSTDGAALS